jgi:hypothetical protein
VINTWSKFYYGFEITAENQTLDFSEGAGELAAEIAVGSYTPSEFTQALKIALDTAGSLTYTVEFDRTTRQLTIESDSNFSLLPFTGTHLGSGPWTLMGFSLSTDRTGASTYTGPSPAGDVYEPQFKLQEYVSSDDYQQAADSTVNRTASGRVEVIKFGIEKFMECNLMFATEIPQDGSVLKSNLTGVTDLRRFLQFLVTKAPVEFIPDSSSPESFEKMILESTPESQNGVGYRLKEMYDKGLPGYFQSGKLKFRVVE